MKSETSLNGISDDGKTGTELHSENISTKALNIKKEPVEESDTKANTTTSEPSSESLCLSVKSENGEEVKRNSAEEIQKTLKNDQQAKIPLKKRGMKFSEDFEKNCGIIVQNPSASQVKDISKSDIASEQTNNTLNDHVNGEVQPASEEALQSCLSEPLKDTGVYKEQKSETDTGKSAAVRETELPSTGEDMKDKIDKDCSTEKITEMVSLHQADSDKRDLDMQEKGASAATEKRDDQHSPLFSKAESTPLLKDVNNALEESSNHEKVTEKPADAQESCGGDKEPTKQSDDLSLNDAVIPKETESKDSEEKTSFVDMDTSESNQMEETKASENVSVIKQVEVCDTDAKDTAISEMNVEKSNDSESEEKPVAINTTETQSTEKDPAKKMDDCENSVSQSSTKTTEILAEGDNIETNESNETSNTKEPVKLSVEKVNKSESFKPAEKQHNSEMTPTENTAASEANTENMANTEGTEKPEHTKKPVICEDNTIHDVTTISDSTPEPMEVEAVAVKLDLTKQQEDDKIEMNSVEHKTTEETSEGKDKPSSLVEKTEVSKETDKESNKEAENVSEEQHGKTETDHPSLEIKQPDTVSKKDTGGEKCTKDDKEHLCQEKESHEDSTTDQPSITDQTKEEKHLKTKTSTVNEESGQKTVSEEPDAKSPSETEKTGYPCKEADKESDKSTDEGSKSKNGEQDSATITEVANGVEAPTVVQAVGGYRKIKPPAHRRKAGLQREEKQGDSESDSNTGRSLRRSPRISRPTPKAVEIHDRKTEKPPAEKQEKDKDEKDDDEEEEEVVVKAVQKKPREKKPDQEGQPKPKVSLLTG